MTQSSTEKHSELSVEETLDRAGMEDISEAGSLAFMRGQAPACCTCGSMVEPDGQCPHGHNSVLREAGMI